MQRLKLNIGCGVTVSSGWVNIDNSLNARLAKWPGLRKLLVALHILPSGLAKIAYSRDIYFCDVRKGLPFPDSSVEIIFSAHFLEHLSRRDAIAFMKECYRVLVRGGIIRTIVPDLAQYAQQYIQSLKQIDGEVSINELPIERFLEGLGIFKKEAVYENTLIRLYRRIYNKDIHKWMYDEYSLTSLLKEQGFSHIQRRERYESMIEDIEKLEPWKFINVICLEAQKL